MLRFLPRSSLLLVCILFLGISTTSVGRASAAKAPNSGRPHFATTTSTQDDWPSFGYDASNTRDNVLETTLNPGNVSNLFLDWSSPTGGMMFGTAAVANGMVYVGSIVGANSSALYAFDEATGTTVWRVPAPNGQQWSSPVVAGGVLYIGSGSHLFALNASTGTQLWQVTANASGPVQVVNGVAYVVGSSNGTSTLSALNVSTGAQLWSTSLSSSNGLGGSPAVANGIVYVGSTTVGSTGTTRTGHLSAFDANTGVQLWSVSLDGTDSSITTPTVANGIVYVGSANDNLYAFNATTGAQLWSVPTAGAIYGSPAVANGAVYIASSTTAAGTLIGHLYAFNASTGAQLWSWDNNAGGTPLSPAVANGVVYVGSSMYVNGMYTGGLYAFNATTGSQLWSSPVGGRTNIAPMVANGIVYIGAWTETADGARTGHIYAFHLSTPPPANTAWYFAEGSIGGGFDEYLTLLNPGGAQEAHVKVQYLFENQGEAIRNYTVAPSTRFTVSVDGDLGVNLGAPQQAISAIVTSDTPIVAERPMYFYRPADLGAGGTDVVGATDITHTSFYFANGDSSQTSTDTSDEYITVLNPSSSQTANIIANYYSGGSKVGTQSISVQPLHRGTIAVGSAFHGKAAIQVTSDIGVVVERPVYSKVNVPAAGGTISGSASTVATTTPGNDWLFAEGHVNDGFQENLVLANFGTSATTATVNLEYTNGTVQSVPVTIDGLSQRFFDVNSAFLNPVSGCNCTPTTDVSIEVTSAAPIVAERVMFFTYGGAIAGMTDEVGEAGPSAHNAYSFAEGFTTGGFDEWLTLQNPNASSEVVAVTLFFNGTIVQQRMTLLAHSRTTLKINDIVVPIVSNEAPPPTGSAYTVSIDVQVLGNGTVVAERPMYFEYLNQMPGGTDVFGYTGN